MSTPVFSVPSQAQQDAGACKRMGSNALNTVCKVGTASALGMSLLWATAAGAQSPGKLMPNNNGALIAANTNANATAGTPPDARALRPQALSPAPTQNQKQYEAQLSAIRQAILQATLDRPTRVLSSAWVDEKGALHESAHFHSEAQVRGVRVMSYLEDGKEPVPQVSAEVLPWGWRTTTAKALSCSAPPRPWRLPLMLQTRTEAGFSGNQIYASQSLMSMVSQVWTQKMQGSQRWRAQLREIPPDNTYLRTLTGNREGAIGWAAELVLKPYAPEADFSFRGAWDKLAKDENDWRWTLSFTLGERHMPHAPIEPQWQVEKVISIDPQVFLKNPKAWAKDLNQQLQSQLQAWVQQLEKRSECEPIQFHVRRNGHDLLQLQAGFESGLRVGDRVLLMNPNHVPSQMLEPGATQHLALAQVVRVGADRTELQQLAGPALAAQVHWMALPL